MRQVTIVSPKNLGKAKEFFNTDKVVREHHFTLKEEYNTVKDEIINLIETKTDNEEYIERGEIIQLPHYCELPCSLEYALTYDADIAETFKAYIWMLLQEGEIDMYSAESFDDAVYFEICNLS